MRTGGAFQSKKQTGSSSAWRLAEAGKAAYKAAQTRKQEAVSEVTDVVATACSHCHEAYRDKPGRRTVADPSNKAGRCVR